MISRFTLNTLIICIIYIVGKTGCYSSVVVHGGGTFLFFDHLYPLRRWHWWLRIWTKTPLPSQWWWIDLVFEKCDLRSFLNRVSRRPLLMTFLGFVWLLFALFPDFNSGLMRFVGYKILRVCIHCTEKLGNVFNQSQSFLNEFGLFDYF